MKTENLLNFEFMDGFVTMHVRVTRYVSEHTGTSFKVSFHSTMRDVALTVVPFPDGVQAMDFATKKRSECYADMASFLQQVM